MHTGPSLPKMSELESVDTYVPYAGDFASSSASIEDLATKERQESIVKNYYNHLLEVIIQGVCLDVYRAHKIDSHKMFHSDEHSFPVSDVVIREPPPTNKRQRKPKTKASLDIFGLSNNTVKKLECECPHCSRTLAASRLAPHLEKCMGMGRNSSRVASMRIANFAKSSNGASSD